LTSTPPLETVAPPESQTEAATASPKAESSPAEPGPNATAPAPAAGELRASGTLGAARGELRSGGREVPRAAEAPSVVIDMGGAPLPAPPPASVQVSPSATTKAVGVMQARPSAAVPATPTAPSGFSIQVDPALMAELAAHEAAKATPAPVVKPAPAPAPAPAAAAKPAPSRVTNGAAPAPAAAAPAPAAAAPAHPPAAVAEPGKRSLRPSSEFDALERDFFAREADLYKQEHPESFDDLDHKRPKNGSR